ncbi:hypothetical protein GS872_00880 [Rhodococcus hoagii]|nr:hypothetical protein [Prescottella equi]
MFGVGDGGVVGDEDVVRRMVPDALDQVGDRQSIVLGIVDAGEVSREVRVLAFSGCHCGRSGFTPLRVVAEVCSDQEGDAPVAAEIVSESASGPEHPGQFGIGLFGGLQVDCLANLIGRGRGQIAGTIEAMMRSQSPVSIGV